MYTEDIQIPLYYKEMSHGTIMKWYVKVGDYIDIGDALYELSTDEGSYIVESFDKGTLSEILHRDGEHKVGHAVGVIQCSEDDRVEYYQAVIGLDGPQRRIVEELSGEMSIPNWLNTEFRKFVKDKISQ